MVYNILNQCSGGAEAMFSGYFQVSTVLTQLCDWTVFSWWGQKHFHQQIIWNQSVLRVTHCCFLLTKNLILFDNITYHQCHDLRTQASTLLYYRLSWEMCVFVRAHYNRICDISLSKRPLSGTSDLSQSEIMSDLILSQDGIDAVWLQIWKLGPDHHYITHHENQHHQTSKI